MPSDSKFTRTEQGDIAVRVVTQTEALPASDPNWMFARDTNGNIAVRVVGAGGGGGGDVDASKVVNKADIMPLADADYNGLFYAYGGETDSDFTHGYVYECVRDSASFSGTVTFEPASISETVVAASASDLAMLASEYISGDVSEINAGTMTYDISGDLWVFVGKKDSTTVGTFQLYTQDFIDAGFTFTGTPEDGDVVAFTCEITDSSTYKWVRIDTQPDSGHNKGWFLDDTELTTQYPTAEAGDYAGVASTGTTWIWDDANQQWIDSYVSASSGYYLGIVPTYADLSSLFPNPQKNDFAVVNDEHRIYYYDGSDWIGSGTNYLGYYASLVDLTNLYPAGNPGDWAIIEQEGTIYVWSGADTDWVSVSKEPHYKGYFPTENDLTNDYPSGVDGDFALVEETGSVWFWNNTNSQWEDTSHFKGYFSDESYLPGGNQGDYAIVESTGTLWFYDAGTSTWKNTGAFVFDDYNTLISIRPTGEYGDYAITGDGVYMWDNNNSQWVNISACHVRGVYTDYADIAGNVSNPVDGDIAIASDFWTIWAYDSSKSDWVNTSGKTTFADYSDSATAVVTLYDNDVKNCSIDLESLEFDFDSNSTDPNFTTQINFTVDANMATPFLVNAPAGIVWYGDDIDANGDFDPQIGTRYCILFFYDGVDMRAIVQAHEAAPI